MTGDGTALVRHIPAGRGPQPAELALSEFTRIQAEFVAVERDLNRVIEDYVKIKARLDELGIEVRIRLAPELHAALMAHQKGDTWVITRE